MLQTIANGSRSNGTSYGYGTWGTGNLTKTKEQANHNHMISKQMWAAQKRSDWDTYLKLQAELN